MCLICSRSGASVLIALGPGLAPERIEELPPIAGRDLLGHAVILRPAARRHVEGAEQAVEQGKVDREILVDRFGFEPVMPMVEARRGDDMADPIEITAYI